MTSLLTLVLYFGNQLLPQLSKVFEGDTPSYALKAVNSQIPFILFDVRKPAIPFYTKRKVMQPADRAELNAILKGTREALVITQIRDLKQLEELPGFTTEEKDSRFALLRWKVVQ